MTLGTAALCPPPQRGSEIVLCQKAIPASSLSASPSLHLTSCSRCTNHSPSWTRPRSTRGKLGQMWCEKTLWSRSLCSVSSECVCEGGWTPPDLWWSRMWRRTRFFCSGSSITASLTSTQRSVCFVYTWCRTGHITVTPVLISDENPLWCSSCQTPGSLKLIFIKFRKWYYSSNTFKYFNIIMIIIMKESNPNPIQSYSKEHRLGCWISLTVF